MKLKKQYENSSDNEDLKEIYSMTKKNIEHQIFLLDKYRWTETFVTPMEEE